MNAAVQRAVFSSSGGIRELTVVADNDGVYSATQPPRAADYPSDLVAAVRDWADAGLQGVHEDYRVPNALLDYLNEVAGNSANPGKAIVASTALGLLKQPPPKRGN